MLISSQFTPLSSFIGGLMLFASTSSLLLDQGAILGVSGIAHSAISSIIPSSKKGSTTRANASKWGAFLGMILGGFLLRLLSEKLTSFVGTNVFDPAIPTLSLARVVLSGATVGLGTRLGSGCTSGHMLCGLSRLSPRSFVATLVFFSTAVLTSQISPAPLPPSRLDSTLSPSDLSLSTLTLLQLPLLTYTLIPQVLSPSSLSRFLHSLFIGMHFTFGLALAGMTSPSKVLSFFYFPFLPLERAWDPSLAMVVLGGLIPNALFYQSKIKDRSLSTIEGDRPRLANKWDIPTNKEITLRLVVGSVLFGIGWGSLGVCPGPLLAVMGSGTNTGLSTAFAASFAVAGLLGNTF